MSAVKSSLVHPRYSGVTMGLLHGCAPDGLVLCYEAGRKRVSGMEQIPLPPLEQVVALYEAASNVSHPCRFFGVAINSRALPEEEYFQEKESVQKRLGLPAWDLLREGPEGLVEAALNLGRELGKDRCRQSEAEAT